MHLFQENYANYLLYNFPLLYLVLYRHVATGKTIFVYVHISMHVCIGKDFPSAIEREGWECSKWVNLFVIQQLLSTAGTSGHNKLMSYPLSHTTGTSILSVVSIHPLCCEWENTMTATPTARNQQLAAPQAYHHWRTNNKLQFIWIQQLVCQECSSKQSKNL